MFRPTHFGLSIALFFCYQISYADSIMNKCTDGNQITYTDKPCEKLGLKDAGPINKNTVTVTPATPITQFPQSRTRENNVPRTDAPASDDKDVYQCTTANNLVTYSSSPCPKSSLLPQGYPAPIQQEMVSRKQACEKVGANSGSSLSCP